MVQFDILKFLSPTKLQVKASVMDLGYFENVYLDSILIDTEDTVTIDGPSSTPAYVYDIVEEDVKSINTVLDVSSVVKGGPKMFFVYIKCTGTPAPNTPCGMDNEYTLKVTIDYSSVYSKALDLMRSVGGCKCSSGDCEIDVVFANFALQYFRMEKALEYEDYDTAYSAYCFIMRKHTKVSKLPKNKNCGCNG